MTVHLLIGTNKGVYLYTSNEERQNWKLAGPFLSSWEAYSVLGDSRHGNRIFAGISQEGKGTMIQSSEDLGETWTPVEQSPSYSTESGFAMNRIWQLVKGAPSQPDTLYAGAEEAGIFVSHDRGQTWRELDGLTKHPTRPDWGPGAGGMGLHTIVVDPQNSKRLWVAMSAVGVFRSNDGGESWVTCNKGLGRVPNGIQQEEVGFCAHKVAPDPNNPDILYMQEHGGVFMTTDAGDNWFPIEEGLVVNGEPRLFGFPIAIAKNGDLFILPLESSEHRSMFGGQLLIWRREQSGDSWFPIGNAMPDEQRHVNVLRDAMSVDALEPYGLYFGTTSGETFCSLDRGVTWKKLPGQLSRILSVKPWIIED
jgi:hypothetical protein